MPENYTGILYGKPFVPTAELEDMPGGRFITDGAQAALLLNEDALQMKSVFRSEICGAGVSLRSEQFLFPSELLSDANGEFKALLMPMPLSNVTLDRVLQEPLAYFPTYDKATAVHLCHNLACAVATLHECGTCCYALRPDTVLVAPDGRVQLHYTALLDTDPYAEPDQHPPSRDRDVTLMGEIVYELLCGGAHPMYDTANRYVPPTDQDAICPEVRKLLGDCFTQGLPHTAAAWCEALKKQIKKAPAQAEKPAAEAEKKPVTGDRIEDYPPYALLRKEERYELYTVKGMPGKFIKRYSEQELTQKGDSISKKLRFLCAHADKYKPCMAYCAFPEKLFIENDIVIGYLSSLPADAKPLKMAARDGISESYAAAIRLIDAVTALQQCGIVPTTLSPETVFVAPDGTVRLINCEQYRFTDDGGKLFPCYTFKPLNGYSAPEYIISRNNNAFRWEESTLSFTLAQLFWELFGGKPVFSGTDAVNGLNSLPGNRFGRRISALFERCFVYTRDRINEACAARPTAAEWKEAFTAREESNILSRAVDAINNSADSIRKLLNK